jgi:hypothetical protein
MSDDNENSVVHYKVDECLNCGLDLHGQNFCPECGQENATRDLSLWTLTIDFLGDYFSFDSKLFGTMVPLLVKPGVVPMEFVSGMRIRHIPPFRILVFTSFIFFFIWGVTLDTKNESASDLRKELNSGLNQSIQEDLLTTPDSLLTLGSDNANIHISGLDSATESRFLGNLNTVSELIDQGMRPEAAVDSLIDPNNPMEYKIFLQLAKVYASDSIALTKYFIGNLSIFILAIQPFFALLLYLLYIRKRKTFKYIRHIVFGFYLHSWILIMCSLGILIHEGFPDFNWAFWVYGLSLLYMFLAIKRFYQQGWIKTILKTVILNFLYQGILIPIFLLLSFILSFYFF